MPLPAVIDLADLAATERSKIVGDAADDRAGNSASFAGDINGDGYDDILVGAYFNERGGNSAGAAYVIVGQASAAAAPFPLVIDLTTLAASDGFIIQGDMPGDDVGWSVASAGDVNGDGIDDIVVGALGGDDGALEAGEAYVVFGTRSGFGTATGGRQLIDLTNLTAAQGFIVQGDDFLDNAGSSVAAAGDVNDDGIGDLIIGAPFGDDGGFAAGEAYVVFGTRGGFGAAIAGQQVIDLTTLTAAQGFVVQGDERDDNAGRRVSSAGDVNGDGIDDMIVGARFGDDGGNQAGEAYVIFGNRGGFGTAVAGRQVIDLTGLAAAQGFIVQGNAAGDNAGSSISAAGDVNGDGIDDLIVGAPRGGGGAGEAYVVFGTRGGFGAAVAGRQVVDLTDLTAAHGFIVQGDAAGDNAGFSVSAAGDVNGDGITDIVVGAIGGDDGGSDAGEAYVVFGTRNGFGTLVAGRQVIDLTDLTAAHGFIVQGDAAGDQAGISVAGAGDVNGDGIGDLIVGAPTGDDGGSDAGEAYVVFGSRDGFGLAVGARQVLDLSSLTTSQGFIVQGDAASDNAGRSVSAAGDVNGDGFDDLIVGAPGGGDGPPGEAYVIFGRRSEANGSPINNPPTQSGLTGDTASFTEGAAPVRLDTGANAVIADSDAFGYEVVRIASGLSGPLFVTEIPDGTGRLYVVGKGGVISIVDPATGAVAATPFLNISAQVSTSGEQGLLGLALAPDYATSGTFYIYMTNLNGDNEVRRYQRDLGNPEIANAASADRILLSPHPINTNHNGGWIDFGPDGLLYIASGDGAVSSNAQSLNSLLGKILRIDPSSDAFVGDPDRDYAIPAGNPFAGATPGLDEIWAYGLRNPFRASFDPLNGNLYIGDVGQNAIEEIDLIPAGVGGLNFGWDQREGTQQFGGPNQAGFTPPVTEYGHGSGPFQGNSVTGGVVYRGPIAGLDGQYVFGDFFNKLWSLPAASLVQGSTVPSSAFALRNTAFTANAGTVGSATSFTTDAAGNLYITDIGGELFQVRASAAPNFAGGQLRVAITANKVAGEDVLGIATSGAVTLSNGTVAGSIVSVGGVAIGAIAPAGTGIGADDLVILLSSGANAARVSTLLQFLTYANTNNAAPSAAPRTITYALDDGAGTQNGGQNLLVFTSNVAVAAVDDAPVAVADAGSVAENAIVDIAVVTNDTDVDGGPKAVIQIGATVATAGTPVTLASGATATLNANGTITYNPNGQFNALTDGSSGAANTSAQDIFAYSLNGGSATTVTVTVTGIAGAGDQLRGGAGNDTIVGTAQPDIFFLNQGGNDSATGGDGTDGFYLGAAFGNGDDIDGGTGTDDQLGLQGAYNLAISGAMLSNVDTIALLSGTDTRFGEPGTASYDYNLSTANDVVGGGALLTVNANGLVAGEDFTFNGQAETDGSFIFFAGMGVEDLTGGAGSDGFFFGAARFNPATDRVDGFTGVDDQVALRGDYVGALGFLGDTITNIDTIALLSSQDARFGNQAGPFRYNLVLAEGNIAAGAQLTVNGNGLLAGETMIVDGSGLATGSLRIIAGAANDTLTGGAGDDRIFGGRGADLLAGGAGADWFLYNNVDESTAASRDTITGFDPAQLDKIDLRGLDAIAGGGNDAFTFIGANAFGNVAGQLRLVQQNATTWIVQGDVNGDGIVDLEIQLSTANVGVVLGETDFFL